VVDSVEPLQMEAKELMLAASNLRQAIPSMRPQGSPRPRLLLQHHLWKSLDFAIWTRSSTQAGCRVEAVPALKCKCAMRPSFGSLASTGWLSRARRSRG